MALSETGAVRADMVVDTASIDTAAVDAAAVDAVAVDAEVVDAAAGCPNRISMENIRNIGIRNTAIPDIKPVLSHNKPSLQRVKPVLSHNKPSLQRVRPVLDFNRPSLQCIRTSPQHVSSVMPHLSLFRLRTDRIVIKIYSDV